MDVLTLCNVILETYDRKVGIRPILPVKTVVPEEEEEIINKPTEEVIPIPIVKKTLYTKVEEPSSSVKFVRKDVPEVPESVRNLVLSRARTRFTNEGTTTIQTSTLVE